MLDWALLWLAFMLLSFQPLEAGWLAQLLFPQSLFNPGLGRGARACRCWAASACAASWQFVACSWPAMWFPAVPRCAVLCRAVPCRAVLCSPALCKGYPQGTPLKNSTERGALSCSRFCLQVAVPILLVLVALWVRQLSASYPQQPALFMDRYWCPMESRTPPTYVHDVARGLLLRWLAGRLCAWPL